MRHGDQIYLKGQRPSALGSKIKGDPNLRYTEQKYVITTGKVIGIYKIRGTVDDLIERLGLSGPVERVGSVVRVGSVTIKRDYYAPK